MNVFHHHRGFIDQNPDGQSQSAERHYVDGLSCTPEGHDGSEQRKGDGGGHDQRTTPVAQEQQDHDAGQQRAEQAFSHNRQQRISHIRRLVKFVVDFDLRRNGGLELREIRFDFVYDAQRRGIGALGDGNVHGPPPIHLGITRDDVAGILYRAHVAEKDGRARTCANWEILQVLNIRNHGIDRCESQQIAGAYVPRRHDGVSRIQCLDDFLGRHAVGTEAIRVNTDDNRSCGTTKGRGGGHSRQSRKQRPHTVQRKILDLRDTPRRTGKNQIADGHAACVEPHNEWGNSARRHKRAGAVDVADGLSQRLAHICFGVKRELNQADILNGFRFHGLNPGDVQEMIFVVVDEIAFHLRGRHAAERLRHVNNRQV